MKRIFRNREPAYREGRPRIPAIAMILMVIGAMTVLYLLITYVLMPVLAMLTVS